MFQSQLSQAYNILFLSLSSFSITICVLSISSEGFLEFRPTTVVFFFIFAEGPFGVIRHLLHWLWSFHIGRCMVLTPAKIQLIVIEDSYVCTNRY